MKTPRTTNRKFHSRLLCILATGAPFISGATTSRAAGPLEPARPRSTAAITLPSTQSSPQVKDALGRVRYIVDLVDDERSKPSYFKDAAGKIAWHKANSQQQIDSVAKVRGIELIGATSLVGTSFIAYLTPNQFDELSKDKRVSQITEDAEIYSSALWNSITESNGEVRPWGLQALLASGASSNGGATVYVLDTGVELHGDLPGLVAADRLTAFTNDVVTGQPINPSGCYPHATHVAGIIGAGANGFGTRGVLPGVRLVSVALGDTNGTGANPCPFVGNPLGSYNAYTSGYIQGLDKIKQRLLLSNQVGIINLSFNSQPGGNQFASNSTVGMKMRSVATPTFNDGVGYKGALIVQSAGNAFDNACLFAFDTPSSFDGILVVGGIDENGQRVSPFESLGLIASYLNAPVGADERGSNGPGTNGQNCVEVWAPSARIYSTWKNGGYQLLSGTSMAAPHVAGFAAWVLENDPYVTTSQDLEAAVRSRLVTLAGSGLAMPRFNSVAETARPSIEVVVDGNLASLGPLSFTKLDNEAKSISWQAFGAAYCVINVFRNSAFYSSQYVSTSGTIATAVPGGQYVWTVACISPQNTQTAVNVSGYVKRSVTAYWVATTTSTYGNPLVILNGGSVYWSIAANAPFDQYYNSTGTDYCHVQSFGYTGNPNGDIENPAYSPVPPFSQALLWDSLANTGVNFPPYAQFATFNFGNPHYSPYGFAPYDGYKWRLDCWNSDGVTMSCPDFPGQVNQESHHSRSNCSGVL